MRSLEGSTHSLRYVRYPTVRDEMMVRWYVRSTRGSSAGRPCYVVEERKADQADCDCSDFAGLTANMQ